MEITDADAVRFAERFRGRAGVHARMWSHPRRGIGYSPVHAPLDADLAQAHLQGQVTVGSYLVRGDDTTAHAVVDLDATRDALAAAEGDRDAAEALVAATHRASLELAAALEAVSLAPALIDSGYKGRHLWCFLEDPAPAGEVRVAVRHAIREVLLDARLRVEVFPKQATVREGGLGNLVKLPLGVHLRTGRPAVVLDRDGQPADDGLQRLLTWPTSPVPEAPAAALDDPPDLDAPDDRSRQVLRACPMLRAAVEGGRRDRALSRDAVLVLNHSLGHLPDGVVLLQQLYASIPELPEAVGLQSPLRGNPISCTKVRKRLPELLEQVPCACGFPERSGAYPHPLRHLDEDLALEHLLAELAEARRRCRELEIEASEQLAAQQGCRHDVGSGAWVRGPDGAVQFLPRDR